MSFASETKNELARIMPDKKECMKPAGRKYEEITLSVVNNADVAILDPPRAGCDRALLEAVIKTGPAKIVYVS